MSWAVIIMYIYFVTSFTNYDDQIKNGEMDEACNTHGRDEECI
jgi:hypothetical protein